MSKISESEHKSEMPDDSEMLDEYDFSQGIRGKYFQRESNNQPESIQAYRTKVFGVVYPAVPCGIADSSSSYRV